MESPFGDACSGVAEWHLSHACAVAVSVVGFDMVRRHVDVAGAAAVWAEFVRSCVGRCEPGAW